LASISFPSISIGDYGYPVAEAVRIAVSTVVSFLKQQSTSLREVVFVLFDSGTYESYLLTLQEATGSPKS
jgi:O-acetyl-ADP-ribose deacetylase (regulator of RNase III)